MEQLTPECARLCVGVVCAFPLGAGLVRGRGFAECARVRASRVDLPSLTDANADKRATSNMTATAMITMITAVLMRVSPISGQLAAETRIDWTGR